MSYLEKLSSRTSLSACFVNLIALPRIFLSCLHCSLKCRGLAPVNFANDIHFHFFRVFFRLQILFGLNNFGSCFVRLGIFLH